jgi:two-component system chemotaxis sensor kinase CheA
VSNDEHHLRDKARLLLQRERELFELRLKHEQMGVWLSIGQALPELFSHRDARFAQAWDGIRRLMIGKLRLQRVVLFELADQELRPLAPAGPARPLPAEARALLDTMSAGCCNDPQADAASGVASLAQVMGLHRFMWSCISRPGQSPVLMAAGFDPIKAAFQSPFVESDVAHFSNAAQHVESLLGNALLIAELEREKEQLREANASLEQRDRELRQAAEELRLANESLEQRVQERTQELAGRNRELRLVLDTVDQALMTIDLQGRLAPERSSAADDWFGSYGGSPRFVEHVRAPRRFASQFELGLDGLRDDFLPREVCLEQMPRRLSLGERQFDCRYLPIEADGQLQGLLLAIDDVTEQLRRAREGAEKRELLAAFVALIGDRSGFSTFIDETERILAQLASPTIEGELQKRLLHTLKGNAASFELQLLSELCHQAESNLENELAHAYAENLAQLQACWSAILGTLRTAVPTELHRSIEITDQQLELLSEQVRAGVSSAALLEQVRRFGWEPSERPLRRLAQHAQALAVRLGKGSLEVTIDADATRLEPERWAPLWSALVHIVRNAVDHGIEPPQERVTSGKPATGRIRLAPRRVGLDYEVEIHDDGRGIDWEAVRRACEARGRPSSTQADLLALLLSTDFSTRAQVTQTSGRGVGLSVLAHVVSELSGSLSVESQVGLGTQWKLSFAGVTSHMAAVP